MAETKKRPNPIDIYVGSRIRLRRNLMGISQEKLGEHLGITFQQIQKYEKGTNRVGASRLQEIAAMLGVPVSFFFEGGPGHEGGESAGFAEEGGGYVVDFMNTAEGMQLNRAFVRISDPKQRRRLLDLIKSMADEDN